MSSVEDQVRRRLQEALVSAGVPQSQVALQVLYWLPDEFIRDYQQLFDRALRIGDERARRPGEDEGEIKAKVPSRLRGKKGSMSAQAGGGKRYKTEWIVKDDQAFRIKELVDRRLRTVIGKAMREVQGRNPGENPMVRGEGMIRLISIGDRVQGRCRDCGRIMRADYVRCPYHNA